MDDEAKRLSALLISLPWRSTIPKPDASIDQGDRQHFITLYSGNLASDPGAAPNASNLLLLGVG